MRPPNGLLIFFWKKTHPEKIILHFAFFFILSFYSFFNFFIFLLFFLVFFFLTSLFFLFFFSFSFFLAAIVARIDNRPRFSVGLGPVSVVLDPILQGPKLCIQETCLSC